ncbi:MAG: HD domain-containing protein [Deltaproteobacteria bacterium]|nr:HD domain-containing protein [Deltaproteobacteria bacterium]
MDLQSIARFLFEVGMLRRTERSGFRFLGSGRQSVAEHILRVAYIGYVLSRLEKGVDTEKLLKMCLFHDLCEARTGDLNYVHKRYVKADEEKAVADMAKELFFGPELKEILREFSQRSTREAHLASDADQLDMILELKEQKDLGNRYASDWLPFVRGRLLTDPGRNLARTILETDWSDWWFRRDDDWWVNADNQR